MAAETAGAASAELVIGWCIFGLLLLVGEAPGVFPVLTFVGAREGPALPPASRGAVGTLRPVEPGPGTVGSWRGLGGSSEPGRGQGWGLGDGAPIPGLSRRLSPAPSALTWALGRLGCGDGGDPRGGAASGTRGREHGAVGPLCPVFATSVGPGGEH